MNPLKRYYSLKKLNEILIKNTFINIRLKKIILKKKLFKKSINFNMKKKKKSYHLNISLSQKKKALRKYFLF